MVEENPPTDTADDDNNGPFPGWYPDPLGVAAERFWNGREWSGNARGEATPATAPAIVPAASFESAAGPTESIPASKPRIFGTATDDTPTLASSTPQGERPKSALVQRAEAGSSVPTFFDTPLSSGPADTQLATAQVASDEATSAGTISDETTSIGKGGAAQSDAPVMPVPAPKTQPLEPLTAPSLVQPAPPADAPRRSWAAVIIAGLCALALGLAVGWFARGSDDLTSDSTTAAPVTTSAEQVDEQATPQDTAAEPDAGTDPGDDVAAVDDEAFAELQGQVDNLSAELDQTQSDLDTMTAERDNEQDHNDILQTWFTPEVRERSERNWNAEVERACNAEEAPTLENTVYTRAMELMGTHADLVAAAVVCRAGG